MDWLLSLSVGLGLLMVVLLAGMPIFLGFLALNLAGVLFFFGPSGFGLFINSVTDTATSGSLSTIPLFIFMGEILFRSGAVDVLFDSVDRMIGKVRGRLYLLVVTLSTLFGALSGSAVAVVAMLGRTLLPQMIDRGYDKKLSAALIQGGASLAPIIPPSLLAVIIGSMADVSVSGLLLAGIIPGMMLAGMMVAWVFVQVWRRPDLAPSDTGDREPLSWAELGFCLGRMLPFGIVIFSVMGLMLMGIATPSEAAATGCVGAMITAAIYRKLSLGMLKAALMSSVAVSAMILIIVAVSVLFGQLLAFTGATRDLVSFTAGLDLHPMLMFLLLMLVPFVLCMFIDQIAFMLVAIPIYAPLVKALEFDPIWFWTLFSINLTVGSLTPPFGYTMFALRAAAPKHITLQEVFAASWPVTWLFLLGMAIMTTFPAIITFLPALLK
jgi:tripartite ATP-independent transporter DctM subunit